MIAPDDYKDSHSEWDLGALRFDISTALKRDRSWIGDLAFSRLRAAYDCAGSPLRISGASGGKGWLNGVYVPTAETVGGRTAYRMRGGSVCTWLCFCQRWDTGCCS